MPYDNVRLESQDGIAILTLNRLKRRNALSLGLMLELLECLGDIEQHRAIRVVVLAAEGSVYCSGHDLTEMMNRTEEEYRHVFTVCAKLMTKIQSIPQPVIAEVQGMATAAGCQLVATCDLAIASDDASFATPGVAIGLFCTTPMVALSRAIGRKRALEMLLTGKTIDAATAVHWGLVNCAVPSTELRAATQRLAQQIARASRLTVSTGKQAYYTEIELPQANAYEHAKEVMTQNALASDAKEGMLAFLEKRGPCWTGCKRIFAILPIAASREPRHELLFQLPEA
jgi:enoyl-CoA hydratase/carnithine racemase